MDKIFSEKLALLYLWIEKQDGFQSLPWDTTFNYPFHQHFADESVENKSGALLAFWGLLEHWKQTGKCPFTGNKKKHSFYSYLDELDFHYLALQKAYPHLIKAIEGSISELNSRNSFEYFFPSIEKDWHHQMRDRFLIGKTAETSEFIRFQAFLEAGIILI
ncbi:hypothetical protein [Bacillus sp. 2205SS5-2]|uniref:hypothetical protein n=1 Tax=Bacillus sp. 2205SS5-2 TaxID=3109031 RepID=UPI00300555A1